MTDIGALASDLSHDRERFLTLVADVRPDLHRYCARMTGSITDGEDIVQETLARAYFALPEVETLPPLKSWLFQIAHNRAVDFLRRAERRVVQPLETGIESLPDADAEAADDALARNQAVRAAVSRFGELVPLHRSCVVLKDVLGHSLDEISALLALSVPSVKAALHRGRARLRELAESEPREHVRPSSAAPNVVRYAALFNARDWDGVRAMLAEDVRLDLVSRVQKSGRRRVGKYLTEYDALSGWRVVPAWRDDREVLAVFQHESDARPQNFIELTFADGCVTKIRDFWYVKYIGQDADARPAL
jgi:RNA polymerase sigma factor (sigma-70 family)